MEALAILQFGFAPALASALLHALWQDALLAVAAWCALAAMARASAALRHTVAMGFLVAMVLVPAVAFLRFWQQPGTQVNAGLVPAMTAPRIDAIPGVFVQESGPVAGVLTLLWLLGVLLMLLRHCGGLQFVGALARRPYTALPQEWQQRVDALQRALGISRAVTVRLAQDVVAPFTARLLRPVIWLPLSLLARLPAEQLEALLAHELAHIRRLDWLWNGVQCVIEALLFFHPGVWWLGRRIRREREHACDDLAVAVCGDAIALAEALVALERQRPSFPRLVLAAQGGSLMQRITRLLSGSRSSGPPSRGRVAARIGLVVLLASGVLLVSQVGIGGSRPGIRITSSTDGVLGPGDVREITAKGLDKERSYRASVDAQGRLSEVYRENGQVRPIDGRVRAWVSEVTRLSVAPPPLPPMPPMPPTAALPPLPPAPPPPPEVAESAVFQSLLRVVAADPGVVAKLGSPVVLAGNDVSGRIDFDDAGGDVDVSFALRGPKGRADVQVEAQFDDGQWSLDPVVFASAVH
ncbi:cytochrome c oxidase assembly factor Coa1 family protein [Lysobacter koreensis]|uniref:Cytochrome c oxidase assembly factor Coa1 family protein n=1 Tax=Lysobacter koreensis TaxID=266122 RepID=A0ABW2YPS7_9GAMM